MNLSPKKERHFRDFVLIRLHARACVIAEEIIVLLENGFSDGAMARWRTPHELTIVATIIEDGGESLASRYIDHNAIDRKRCADEYDLQQVASGAPIINWVTRAAINRAYSEALRQYGKSFSYQ
jgi:hypothetical protein